MPNINLNLVNKIFFLSLVITFGVSIAFMINTYISSKFFSLPKINDNPEKNNSYKKESNKNYEYIKYVLLDDIVFPNLNNSSNFSQNKLVKRDISLENKNIITIKDIKLKGIIKLRASKFALLRKGNLIKFVKEGDRFSGYKVKKIDDFTVLLEKDSKLYKVSIDIDASSSVSVNRKLSKVNTVSKNSEDKFIKKDSNVIQVDKRFIEEKTEDIGTIFKNVLLVPEIKNGQTIGFRFKYIKPNTLLYKLGLRSGDLILSVNNMPIRTAEEAFKIYNMVRNEKYINIEIERKGQRKVLTYEIR